MNALFNLLLLVLPLPSQGKVEASASAVSERFETLSNFEIERRPNDLAGLGAAIDVTADGKSLIYLSAGIHRLDLGTGRVETVVPDQELRAADLEHASPLELHMTAVADRLVYVEESGSPCPWRVFLISTAPFSAKLLTEHACGRIALSSSRDRLAVITSQTCEGRGCGDQRLLLFNATTGRLQFDSRLTPDYIDVYWEDDETLTFRYHDRSDAQEQRHYYKVISAHFHGARWQWTPARPSPVPRVPAVDVDYDQSIKVKADGSTAGVVRLEANGVFGPPPEEYRAEAPRVFRAGDRIVIVRRLLEKEPAPGVNPRRREQIAVLKLKEAK